MQRSAKTLTDLSIQSLAPGYHWDASFPSFGVYKGKRATTFILVKNGGRRIKIGRYPTISLKDARKRAHGFASSSDAPADTIDVSDALEAYFASLSLRPKTASEYKRLLSRLGLKGAVSKLSALYLLQQIDCFKSTPQEARHIFFATSAFMTWCKQRHLISAHPLRGTRCPYKPKSRSRTLSENEIKAIWKATEPLAPHDAIVRLCLLTGQRRTECSLFTDEWITDNSLTIPSEYSKNHDEHSIPINDECLALISYLSPTFNSWSKSKAALDTKSGVSDWVLHDIRRTFSTIHARIGTPPHITEALLNHKTGTLTPLSKIYNQHRWEPEMRAAMLRYWQHLSRLLSQVASS